MPPVNRHSNYTLAATIEGTEQRLRERFGFLPKDFVVTTTGHAFASVGWGLEDSRLLATLRYRREGDGFVKLSPDEVHRTSMQFADTWMRRCPRREVVLPAILAEQIQLFYRPTAAFQARTQHCQSGLSAIRAIGRLTASYPQLDIGLTGSQLLSSSGPNSDIDLVVYGHAGFLLFRSLLQEAVRTGQVQALTPEQWIATHQRRSCHLDLQEYVWHEVRKWNKFSIQGTKVDVSCIDFPPNDWTSHCSKIEQRTIVATVVNDTRAFAQPAEYRIDHPTISKVVAYTPTYTGQAFTGETVEARGWVERRGEGEEVLVVGSSREAPGEWIRVLRT